jgi:hypothetical protein
MKKKLEEIPEIDPKKLFDKENYNTLIVGKEEAVEESAKDKVTAVIELLSSKETKDLKHDTLKILKEENALDLLIKAINKTKNQLVKQNLVAACWEADIDCTKQLSYFVDLALNNDFNVTLEATTVIQEMLGPFDQEELKRSIVKIEEGMKTYSKEDKGALLDQLLNVLQTFAGN